jgi:hypothetical protein
VHKCASVIAFSHLTPLALQRMTLIAIREGSMQEVSLSVRMGVLRATPATFRVARTFITSSSASSGNRRALTFSTCPLSLRSSSGLHQTSHGGLCNFSKAQSSFMTRFGPSMSKSQQGLVAHWEGKKIRSRRQRGLALNSSQVPEARGARGFCNLGSVELPNAMSRTVGRKRMGFVMGGRGNPSEIQERQHTRLRGL